MMHAESLEFGKKLQSPLTGYVHYCFEDPTSRETVPLFENFTFALALLRARRTETVLEAKELLQRLLSLQTKEGGFPVYLHEYPLIRKPLGNVSFLFPLLYIYEGYHHVLGKEMQERLESALKNLHSYLLSLSDMPKLLAFQIHVFEARHLKGERPTFPDNLISSKDYADLLIAANLLGEKLSIPWHEGTNHFAGPPLHELFDRYAPRLTLLDYLIKPGPVKDHPLLLHASLLFPVELSFALPENKEGFSVVTKENFFLTVLKQYAPGELHSKGFHLMRLVFGDHVLAFQETAFHWTSTLFEDRVEMVADYPAWVKKDKHGDMEYALYINHKPAVDILVHGKKATVFYLGDPLTITNGKESFTLILSLEKGDARLCGHISRGNRPAQISKEIDTEYEAFDWEIGLRTLDRPDDISIKATLFFHS